MADHRSARPPGRISSDADVKDLVARMRSGERRAVASVITELERLSSAAPALLKALQPYLGRALVVGFTGPPGAGKSTLVNAVIANVRASGRTVGVIAVDPSSPVSGGAILGDRIRMTAALDDEGVFVRSLASRGYVGGLSPAAVRIIDALDAAGRDLILLETVGTGQSEIDVAEVADIRIVISAPGLGDDIQAMKSGLLEIADILVVNKGDRPGAELTLQQLIGALSLRHRRSWSQGRSRGTGRAAAPSRPLPHRARCCRSHRRSHPGGRQASARQPRRSGAHRRSCA
jgi:LAO/AO transport system kinase